MIRPIVKYGHRVLHETARAVSDFTPEVDQLVEDMFETMYAAPGIGLAAPQVGVPLRILVIDLTLGRNPNGLITLINPEFLTREGMQLEDEGCLSLPGFNATVARPERVHVRGLDRTGAIREYEGKDLLARAFQHEMDHLEGTLFIDHLSRLKRSFAINKVKKAKKVAAA